MAATHLASGFARLTAASGRSASVETSDAHRYYHTPFQGRAFSARAPHPASRTPKRAGHRVVSTAEMKGAAAAAAAALSAAGMLALAGPALAGGDVLASGAEGLPTIAAGAAALAAAGAAAYRLTDPEARRQRQAVEAGGDDVDVVRKYFNSTGYDRWKRIYGETDDVNDVQMDIRVGHAQTVAKVLNWLRSDGNLSGLTVCDLGCGTGSLTIPLAEGGAKVSASDIAEAMVTEAALRWKEAGSKGPEPNFEAKDLESVKGKYHTVCCLDVLIHYPDDKSAAMIGHLGSLAEERIILSFAPKTFFLSLLKRIGELFPGPSKATRAYLHTEELVESALKEAGFTVRRREMTSTKFYFSRLLEATRS